MRKTENNDQHRLATVPGPAPPSKYSQRDRRKKHTEGREVIRLSAFHVVIQKEARGKKPQSVAAWPVDHQRPGTVHKRLHYNPFVRRIMKGLKNKRVLITGGASGIGAATAARFLEEGSRVCVLDRDAEACARIKQDLAALGAAIIGDVTDLMQVEAAFAEAIRVMDCVDVLINNAGISIRHKFLDITPEEWERVISVNLTGVFFVAQTAARHMWERGSGVILQTASTNGVMGYPYYADYNATKAGVIELTRSMALELAPKVRVCAVAPGYVLTPMQRAEYTDAMLAEVNRKIPMGRHASPEEIAGLFAYLASDDAAFATGQVFTLDGGETAGGLASR
jgi:meso-butanediol dehydrogenase / (S,S)-butanediol dehydrogenase / diacetyl reductase